MCYDPFHVALKHRLTFSYQILYPYRDKLLVIDLCLKYVSTRREIGPKIHSEEMEVDFD